ncbi:hypothetical protein [Actinomadura sp. 6N118]|uniref:hypothetical protein n=1 Tax=Actinomadura sp. 6N118 TaxID=3375151 RepID=UPI0037B962E6
MPGPDNMGITPPDNDKYNGWDWREIKIAVTGAVNTDLETATFAQTGTSNPQSLNDAAWYYNEVYSSLWYAATELDAGIEKLVGIDNPTWKGDAADAFKKLAKKTYASVRGHLEPLEGPPSYSQTLYDMATLLQTTINQINQLDGTYAQKVLDRYKQELEHKAKVDDIQPLPGDANGSPPIVVTPTQKPFHEVNGTTIVHISAYPDIDRAYTTDARKEFAKLTEGYKKAMTEMPEPAAPPPGAPVGAPGGPTLDDQNEIQESQKKHQDEMQEDQKKFQDEQQAEQKKIQEETAKFQQDQQEEAKKNQAEATQAQKDAQAEAAAAAKQSQQEQQEAGQKAQADAAAQQQKVQDQQAAAQEAAQKQQEEAAAAAAAQQQQLQDEQLAAQREQQELQQQAAEEAQRQQEEAQRAAEEAQRGLATPGAVVQTPAGAGVIGPDGKTIIDPKTGKPILGPDGKPFTVGPDGRTLIDPQTGKPLRGPDGKPLTIPPITAPPLSKPDLANGLKNLGVTPPPNLDRLVGGAPPAPKAGGAEFGGTGRNGQQPMYPPPMGGMGGMGGGGGAGGEQNRDRTTWLTEEEEVWGAESEVGAGVLGR